MYKRNLFSDEPEFATSLERYEDDFEERGIEDLIFDSCERQMMFD